MRNVLFFVFVLFERNPISSTSWYFPIFLLGSTYHSIYTYLAYILIPFGYLFLLLSMFGVLENSREGWFRVGLIGFGDTIQIYEILFAALLRCSSFSSFSSFSCDLFCLFEYIIANTVKNPGRETESEKVPSVLGFPFLSLLFI